MGKEIEEIEENKTSKKDYELFKSECRKWQPILNLNDWYIDFEHDLILEKCEACANMDLNAKAATLILSTEWVGVVNDRTVKMAAFHEMCEVFLCQIQMLANERFNVSPEQIVEATHSVIQVLMNVLYPKYDKSDCSGKCEK